MSTEEEGTCQTVQLSVLQLDDFASVLRRQDNVARGVMHVDVKELEACAGGVVAGCVKAREKELRKLAGTGDRLTRWSRCGVDERGRSVCFNDGN